MYAKKLAIPMLSAFALLALTAPFAHAQDETQQGRAPWMMRRMSADDGQGAGNQRFQQPAQQDGEDQQGGNQRFAQRRPPNFDANGDGSVDLDEFKKAAPPDAPRNGGDSETFFKKIDANGDGKISQDEFKASAPRRHGRPQGERPQGDRPQGQRQQGFQQGQQARQ